VAACVVGLLVGSVAAAPATASPDNELIWEEGTVTSISDGDTLVATMDAGPGARGSQRVRTIGVQAPEVSHNGTPAECGAAQATDRLRAQLPAGSRVQTRSVDVRSNDDYSGGRIVRSLYGQDEEGNWYDTSRGTVSDGWLMWFPLSATSSNKPEWAHNLEYRVLADDAAGQGRGLWSANLCGGSPYPGADLRVWAKYWGTEEVYVENRSSFPVDLTGWTIRDSAISGYQTLPDPNGPNTSPIVPPGQTVKVFSGDMNLNNLPADNAAFEGDAVYLMDNAGPNRTGNLRAWFPYPCNPDSCGDPAQGALAITSLGLNPPPVRAPSAPGVVAATASTDGSGNVTVTWAHATDPGGPNLSYTVNASSAAGTVPAPATGITGTSHTFSGLTLGRDYSFTVKALQPLAGQPPLESDAVAASVPVAPAGPPGVPTNALGRPRDGAAVVSWTAPAVVGGLDVVGYTATSVEDPSKQCSTTDGATSCLVPNLVNGTQYTFTVRASNPLGVSGPSNPSPGVTPGAYAGLSDAKPDAPTDVMALPSNASAVVSWTPPANDGGHEITSYVVSASGPGTHTCTAPGGTTSCVVNGLTNGTPYTFTVVAENAKGKSADSLPTPNSVTPFANATTRTSPATGPAPVKDPWIGGQAVDLTNTSEQTLQLGGYGLWDAMSSRFPNGGSLENRAAYLFPTGTSVAPGQTLRVQLVTARPPVPPADTTNLKRLWTGMDGFVGTTADFVEVANLNGAQVTCTATPGGSCRAAKPVSISSSPVGVTARTTPSSVTVNWGAPISRGGTAITGYTATAFDAPVGGNTIGGCSTDGTSRSCSFPGGIGTRYYVEVTATNVQGVSGPSWRVLAAPKTVPSAPGNVAVSGTPGGLNITWTPAAENGATITKYTASVYTAGTGGSPVRSCTTSNGSLTGCTVLGLQGGTTYFVDVTASNRAGTGAASSPRLAAQPGPGGAVSTYSKGKVTVRWDAPTPGSNTVTGYLAKAYTKASGGSKVGECTAPAGATQCTTKKMKKRSKYYIELTMRSAAGDFTIKPRIVTGPPKKASAPPVTSATPSGRSATITWAPPNFNGYSYLKGYGARLYSKAKGGSVKASCTANASTVACTTKAVKKKGTYYAAARVKNSKGWSSWSKRVKVVIP
jgi:endonuclease YncB( thermonuclease family)